MTDIDTASAQLISVALRGHPAAVVVAAKNYAHAAFYDPDPIGRLLALGPISQGIVVLVEAMIADIAEATRRSPGRWELAVRSPF